MENQVNEYQDIDKLVNNQNKMLDNALEQQNNIVDKQTQMNVQRLEQNKADIDKEVDKTNRGIYQEYRKAQNPYGYNAEALASRGLTNSGYAESTQAKMYNTYQGNITNTMNNARDLKANFDVEISQAMQSGDLQKAQNAFDIYNQKMQLLAQEYQLRNDREKYLYQKSQDAQQQANWQDQFNYSKERDTRDYNYQLNRDKVSDERYNKEFDYQANRDKVADERYNKEFEYQQNRDKVSDDRYNQEFEYQKNRDQVADNRYQQEWEYQKQRDAIADDRYLTEQERQRKLDELDEYWRRNQWDYQVYRDNMADSQWEREYELQKKKSESSGRSYGGSSGGSYENEAYIGQNNEPEEQITPQQLLAGVKMVQGPNISKPVYDSNSGRYFSSIEEMLNAYGYGSMD